MAPSPTTTAKQHSILCFDSGIGGLAYLPELRQLAPELRWLYLADNASFPFGQKSGKDQEKLRQRIVRLIAAAVESYQAWMVVLLCNTATVLALPELRCRLPNCPVVGTVPAIKPAAAASRRRRLVLLASGSTSKASYVAALHRDFAADCQLMAIDAGPLIHFIETDWPLSFAQPRPAPQPADVVQGALRPYLAQIVAADADQVVLGCTHFLHLRNELQEALSRADRQISLCDSRQGVRQRVLALLPPERGVPLRGAAADQLLLTAAPQGAGAAGRWRFWAERLGLQCQVWPVEPCPSTDCHRD